MEKQEGAFANRALHAFTDPIEKANAGIRNYATGNTPPPPYNSVPGTNSKIWVSEKTPGKYYKRVSGWVPFMTSWKQFGSLEDAQKAKGGARRKTRGRGRGRSRTRKMSRRR